MGDGKKNRSGKRAKSSHGIDKSSSDTELANQDKRRTQTSRRRRQQWAFIDGLTVDNLARFRRRRVEAQPKDTLGPHQDDMKDLITEYRYAFRSSDDIYRAAKENLWGTEKTDEEEKEPAEEEVEDEGLEAESLLPTIESKSDIAKSESAGPSPRRSVSSFSVLDDFKDLDKEELISTAIEPLEESSTMKEAENDTTEHGEFYASTEYSAFVSYEGFHRPQLARRGTSLKMEGDIQTTTEKCDQFIHWLNVKRPKPMRVPTNLKLEGDIETSTENHEQYVPFLNVQRSEAFRHHDHLRLEGESRFLPEYMDVFKEFDIAAARQECKIPASHLKPGGQFYDSTEMTKNFVSPRSRQAQLMEELAKDVEAEEKNYTSDIRREIDKKREEDMKVLVAKLEDLKGPPTEIPEYKDAYKNFARERPVIYKRDNAIGKADGSKVTSTSSVTKFPLKIDQDPEYKSIYLDLPKDRPSFRSPSNLRSGPSSGRGSVVLGSRMGSREYLGPARIPRPDPFMVPPNIKLEHDYDLQPEYPNQYHPRRTENYMDYPDERKLPRRPRERSTSASRNDSYWSNPSNVQNFGAINAAEDQDAFQLLQTRVHEESIVDKPPVPSRRLSRAPRPTHLDFADRSILQNRSPSPSYRLHVHNVDEEGGFGRARNRSPSVYKSSEKQRDTSQKSAQLPEITIRSYSPSFANKEKRGSSSTESFVVLDNALPKVTTNNNSMNEAHPRRRTQDFDQNSNSEYSSSNLLSSQPRERPRNRTPPNWMPPWYDSTDTI